MLRGSHCGAVDARLGHQRRCSWRRVITTNPDTSLPCPNDKVNRLFKADRLNKLWVSDFLDSSLKRDS